MQLPVPFLRVLNNSWLSCTVQTFKTRSERREWALVECFVKAEEYISC